MEKDQRPRREGAGVNRNLSVDFVWPGNFGTDNVPTEIVPEVIATRSDAAAPSTSTKKTRSSNYSLISLERKRLAILKEKKRQELEQKQRQVQFELEQKQKETENSIRLLEMEHDLQNAELDEQEEMRSCSEKSRTSIDIPENKGSFAEEDRVQTVTDWIQRIPEVEVEDVECKRDKEHPNNDIKMLCETLSNVLKSVPSPSIHNKSSKLLARHTVDKDFPRFDGNPREWPLFYKQFQNICSLCEYSNEEIMLKLQSCLKGDAKGAVAGMMLTPENVNLVIQTLQMRFGRPEQIIDAMLFNVRSLPYIRETNLEKLIQFSTEVCNVVSIMKTLNSTGHLQNPQLLKDLLYKLPDTLKLKWGEVVVSKKGLVNLQDFSQWIGEVANAACYVSTPQSYNVEKHGQFKQHFQAKKPERVFSTHELKKNKCYYCEKDHREELCPRMKEDSVDKRWNIVTKKKLCFSCLNRSHHKFKCRLKKKCDQNGCQMYHHFLLHKDPTDKHNSGMQEDSTQKVEMVCTLRSDTKRVILRMIPVQLYGPAGVISVLALCDEASTVTLLDAKIAERLGLTGPSETLCLQWTNDEVSIQQTSLRMDVQISKPDEENNKFIMRGVRTIKNMSLPTQNVNMSDLRKYRHLKGLPISDIRNEKPLLLIGQDNANLIIARQIRSGPENLPVASKCRLGWAVHGPCDSRRNDGEIFRAHTLHICENKSAEDELIELVKNSFSTESFGVLVTADRLSVENERALKIMNETIKKVDRRYEIGLLWRHDNIQLPESRYRALQRMRCVEKKCRQNDKLGRDYCDKIRDYEEKGYIRKLTREEADTVDSHTWYLPHFAVHNPNKPNKIRIVFDAAAKSHGVSLNDNLIAGPDLLQSLVAILWKFRQRRFGFCGDVREMFHRVGIRKEDRCAQRFLWRNLEIDRDPDTYEMLVMTFGATCSPVCAQFVKNLNAERFAEDPEIQRAIITKFYVDDYLDSRDDEEEALNTIQEVCRIQKIAGFEVVNWMTNSPLIKEKLLGNMLMASSKNIDDSSMHRVLGMWWNSDSDEFSFKFNTQNLMLDEIPSKRKILKSIMSLFDPLGLIACFTIKGKILMQDIWRARINWDDLLPENLLTIWRKWIEEFHEITKIRIPRCYSLMIPNATSIDIHAFCDSSEKAFASVVYLRTLCNEKVDISLIAAKTRVAPLKPLSIPKLELQAAVMSSRLVHSIKTELEIQIKKTYFWSDSRCVLKWIRANGRDYKQFVAHRVGEIQERTNISDWRWVPSEYNTADEATRDTFRRNDRKKSAISENWFSGPDFLKLPEEFWPREGKSDQLIEDDLKELKSASTPEVCLATREYENVLPEIKRFSKWLRLVRSTAWLLRFTRILKNKILNVDIKFPPELTIDEIKEAEKQWIQRAQQQCFPEDIRNLKLGKTLSKQSSLHSLCPEFKDGFLVLGGRTNLANELSERTKQPIILSPKHDYVKLLIHHYHENLRHRGVELVLNEIRQDYWLINGRAAVKSIFSRCQVCKNQRAKPIPPMMGQLPEARLSRAVRPFMNVGMDYFGPIHVTVGRRKEKRWGVIFTCLAVRAIHLEVSYTLNSDSTVMAIMRMACRRGKPQSIFCDNGTNFVAAAKELKESLKTLNRSAVIDSMSSKGIDFKFNPPTAAHMGGAWERLIGTVKRTIGKVLHDQSLRDETLQTFFVEAEKIVNSRPLTKVSIDPNDHEALTPNHFLLGSSNGDCSVPMMNPDSGSLRREWRKSSMLADSFWKRWVREYLPTLTKRTKWTKESKPIQVDDVVVLVDNTTPRYEWKMGRVTAVHPGPDGRTRVVNVKTATSEYTRPVTKICRLELEET